MISNIYKSANTYLYLGALSSYGTTYPVSDGILFDLSNQNYINR